MKTKLLKKIRKQYSIVYYPDGYEFDGRIYHKNKYIVTKCFRILPIWLYKTFDSKNIALSAIMREVRKDYAKYSRKYKKPNYNGIKVWHV